MSFNNKLEGLRLRASQEKWKKNCIVTVLRISFPFILSICKQKNAYQLRLLIPGCHRTAPMKYKNNIQTKQMFISSASKNREEDNKKQSKFFCVRWFFFRAFSWCLLISLDWSLERRFTNIGLISAIFCLAFYCIYYIYSSRFLY